MKSLRQSRMLKAVAAVLLFFSIVSIPASVVGEMYLAEVVFDGNWEEFIEGEYNASNRFSDLFGKRIGQLAEYVELRTILEKDNRLDYNKTIRDNADSQIYTIGELIKSNSFFVEDIDSQSTTLLETLFDRFPQTEWYVYTDEDGNAALGCMDTIKFIKDFSTDVDWILVENYDQAIEIWEKKIAKENAEEEAQKAGLLTSEGKEIEIAMYSSDAVMDSISVQEQVSQTTGLPQDACRIYTMEDLAYRYTYYVAYYQHYQTLFENDREHRFVYSLKIGDEVYSNADIVKAYVTEGEPSEGTLYYSSEAYTVDTNIPNVERVYVDNLEKAIQGEPFEFYAAVTRLTDFPNTEDDAFTIKENYCNRAKNLGNILIVIGVVGLLGTFASGLYLVASAGHAKDVEGVRLTWFDKWYTEPAAVVCISVVTCCVLFTVGMIQELVWYYGEFIIILLAVGAGVLASYLTILFSLASLLRRIKAGTLWKNSLIRNGGSWLLRVGRRFSHGCHVVYMERDITTRVIVAYVIVLVATVITGMLIMISLFEESVIILFFLLLFAGIHLGTLYILLRERMEYKRIMEGVERISDGDLNYKVDVTGMQSDNKRLAVAVNRVSDGFAEAVEKSIKDERMKTDLITNVSHDIKTPLTSIINYVDLLKREKIEDEKILSYIEVLDNKSQRLKNLTDDLVEASKLSSGTVVLTMQELNLVELVHQANGEFTEKFAQKNLTIISTLPDNSIIVEADGRRLWRVLENLYNNVAKYAMENTRVYVTVVPDEGKVSFVMKNISANPLNINADELTERFIRGDVSRSTEGSGLGLSIARSLTELMGGSFEIYLDGDLFRVTVTFPVK